MLFLLLKVLNTNLICILHYVKENIKKKVHVVEQCRRYLIHTETVR